MARAFPETITVKIADVAEFNHRVEVLEQYVDDLVQTANRNTTTMAEMRKRIESLEDEMEEVRGWCGPLAAADEEGER